MEAKVSLLKGFHFEATVSDSGYRLEMDTAPEHGGAGVGARPIELILAGLAGCTAFDVITILRKARQVVTGLEVVATGDRRNEDPKIFTHIHLEYIVRGRNVAEDVLKRAITLSEEKYCSVSAMLKPTVAITTSYKIEAEEH